MTNPELQPLQGSEKQIQWAAQIRNDWFSFSRKELNKALKMMELSRQNLTKARWQRKHDAWVESRASVAKVTDAKWWIENRERIFHPSPGN